MKIVLAITGIAIVGGLVLGLLFVRWANSDEQVGGLQKERERESAKSFQVRQINFHNSDLLIL
jgi:hypothetical protein